MKTKRKSRKRKITLTKIRNLGLLFAHHYMTHLNYYRVKNLNWKERKKSKKKRRIRN